MKALLDGYARFRKGYWRRHKKRFSTLARDGQSPPAMIIACADSRVAPEMIFDCAPGEIFVVRNVSALVPPYAPDTGNHGTSAALEFAVTALKVRSIVVLGHSQCGGIRALMHGPRGEHDDFIASWMAIAHKARQRVCDSPDAATQNFDTLCYACELESIRVSLANLMTFPWVAARVTKGDLTLAGMHFNVQTGKLDMVS
ncbi:MAG TPA: carbonic anhydrase [Acidocella sp.]|nr:carbonic anhydrase [Acidocella sp.]